MWNNIIGQNRVKNILKNIYSSGRIPHSFIFYGNTGVGKDAMAFEFAKYINCENPSEEKGACDICFSCKQIKNFTSTNYKFITALPSSKPSSSDDDDSIEFSKAVGDLIKLEIANKIKDNYYKINIPKANSISIESIRQVRKEIYLTSDKGKHKIAIISNADLMTAQAANSFLKVLEEPQGNALIILTTSRINSLLPTIIGRCQKIKFDNIKENELKIFMDRHYPNVKENEKNLIIKISNGSLNKLKDIIDNESLSLRNKVIDLLRAIVKHSNLDISNIIYSITQGKDRELVKQFLTLMIVWFRDIIIKKSNNSTLLINKDVEENVTNFVKKFQSDDFEIINLLGYYIDDIDRNINIDLLMYDLVYNIRPLIRIVR